MNHLLSLNRLPFILGAWALVVGMLAPSASSAAAPALQSGEYYLAHNLWYENPERLYSINYKTGAVLPAGSIVSKVQVNSGRSPSIQFFHKDSGSTFTIQFTQKYHGSLTPEQFKDRMLTSESLETRTAGMSQEEKQAIAAAQTVPGMSKEAVLIAWGYPPEHRTAQLEVNTWTFWTSRFVTKTLQFDADGKLLAAPAAGTAAAVPERQAKASPPLKAGEFYLAHNVWYENPDKLYSINYKRGNILPAGSVVSNIRFKDGRTPKITFHHNDTASDYTIHFTRKYHGALSAEKFKDRMLTTETLEARTAHMTELEKNAIAAAQVTAGMSKQAVLLSWGYPPEHRTASTESSSWIFWTSRFVNKTLVFNPEGKLQ